MKKKYARVISNLTDEDYEFLKMHIGQVGKVIEVDSNYSCFSDVLLQFKEGFVEWFPNTALQEITKEEYENFNNK